jgi:DNA-directed RNA polymerase specialized sigma24 family protein
MDLFGTVERDFAARRASGELSRALQEWQAKDNGLPRFADLDALIAACRDSRGGSWESADVALAALCKEASSGDDRAGTLLLWLLLPGLLLARSRLAPIGVLGPEELTSEMVAGAWAEATRVPAPARQVASRLLNAARWRALAAVREAIDWTGRTAPLGGEIADTPAPGEYVMPYEEADPLAGAVREGVLSKEQAELVIARRVAIRAISERLGISLSAAQKRRHRARARLRTWADPT